MSEASHADSELTLAIPYHSQPHYLKRALSSLTLQTSRKWSAIVCDDSLSGEGADIVRQFTGLPITHLTNPNPGGIARNWNFAISQVKSSLFSLFHADDECEPGYVEAMIALGQKYPEAGAFYCHTKVIDSDSHGVFSFPDWFKHFVEGKGEFPRVWQGEAAAAQLLRGNFIFCPTVVYRKSRLPQGFFRESLTQVMDLDLFLRMIEQNDSIVGIGETLYRYRRHDANLTARQTQTLLRFREESALYDAACERYKEKGWGEAARIARQKKILKLHLLYRALTDFGTFHWGNLPPKFRLFRSWHSNL